MRITSNGRSSKNQAKPNEYIRSRFFDVSWTRDDQSHWTEWEFSVCPTAHRQYCYSYECSRELPSLIAEVDWVRHGTIPYPNCRTLAPPFECSYWPATPFLAIPGSEREQMIQEILAHARAHKLNTETLLPGGRWIRRIQYEPARKPLHACLPDEIVDTRGRGTPIAKYPDRLRALGVYRLSKTRTLKEVMYFLREHCQTLPYCRISTLKTAIDSVSKYLHAFSFIANTNIRNGFWFPPFGEYIVKPVLHIK